jgi:protein-disulfide isomerase
MLDVSLRIGDSETEPSLIYFGNYACEFCRELHDTISTALVRAPNLSIAYMLFAPSPASAAGERAAVCAAEQGRFREMNDLLYTTTDWFSANWDMIAEQVDINDRDAFRACLTRASTGDLIRAHSDWGTLVGVRSTPSLVMPNGHLVRGFTRASSAITISSQRSVAIKPR